MVTTLQSHFMSASKKNKKKKINKWKTQKKSNCRTEDHCSFDLPPCFNPLLPLYCFFLFWISSILQLASHATCFSIAYEHFPILLVPLLPYLAITTAPAVLSMWSCKLKLDDEKSKHAYLAQQNGFGPAFQHNLLRVVTCTAKQNIWQRRVMNMIWPLIPVFAWSLIMIGPSGLLVVISHLFLQFQFSFYGEVGKM